MSTPAARALLLLALAACADPSGDGGRKPGGGGDDTARDTADTDTEPIAGRSAPWTREVVDTPGPVSFNELVYAAPDGAEWVELHNPLVLDVDLSGWRLDGGVAYTFPEGTILAAGGYLVVAADPGAIAGVDALGPWEGDLADGGERVELVSNGGRRIDALAYGDDDPWPVAAAGSGLSFAKVRAETASDLAENWTASAEVGGTPGRANALDPDAPPTTVTLVARESAWRYDASGAPPDGWADPDHDDGAWPVGDAVFYAGGADVVVSATVWVTADNYYGVYLGEADGTDLRLVAEDPDGNWMTVEGFDIELSSRDHLFLAAWEAPWDYGGPQMVIAQVDLPDDTVGTSDATFEWTLGAPGACPGTAPTDPPPDEAVLADDIADADATGSWASPPVEAGRSSSPWGWAVQDAFVDATRYVWVDTFSDTSVTNTSNTYALFRSVDPLAGPGGATELFDIPTTTLFRATFTLDADPAATELLLACTLDDGAVVHLNGEEVYRSNLPSGSVGPDTLASAAVDATDVSAVLPTDALVRGENVLAVEVHQATRGEEDLVFGCALTARISVAATAPPVRLNEVAPGGDAPYAIELVATRATDTDGLVLTTSAGASVSLPAATLTADSVAAFELDLGVAAGDVLFLWSADGATLYDAVRVSDRPRARDDGAWRYPAEATFGAENVVALHDDVVVNEIQYHRAPVSEEGVPYAERDEEWIELYNRGEETVDLGGWQLVDAVAFQFPAGTTLAPGGYLVVANDADAVRAEHPDVDVIGDFDGRLGNTTDRVVLLDADGNLADAVRYYDGGRWPEAADGGGATLELRDPYADNDAAEAWAASDETARSSWQTYTYRGPADPSAVGPDGVWNEFVMGLLDAGEVLLDDLRVVEDPDGAARDILPNGTFEDTDRWRLLGTHRHAAVVPDPDDPSNPVLRLVATGPTEHMHNHVETTLTRSIGSGEYEISFRARWVSGNNQLHTRLYFNRLPRATRIARPSASGTPGAPNSAWGDDIGPTFADLAQDVAIPAAGEPVTISVAVTDPGGVSAVTLWSRDEGGAFASAAMTETAPGVWTGTLDGRDAGALVQFYVEAEDGGGATATFPAAGPDSRALVRWDDGEAATTGLHTLRILMTEADANWFHDNPNLMSNDAVGATVVYGEHEVFYDVGVRAKGSERGRPETVRLGFGLSFPPEQRFRGRLGTVLVDRSEGVNFGQREVLLNLVMARAGLVSAEHNDLVHVVTPRAEHTGAAELQLDRFTNLVLDAQFQDGAAGPLYDYELVYYPYTTDDGTAEGLKLPQPDSVTGTSITDLGSDPEAYRWTFMLQNNEGPDDFAPIVDLAQTFALSGEAFLGTVEDVIDVDLWMRAFAVATLAGAVDNYGGDGSWHNARFYVRPADGRVLYFPHDLDFFGSATMAVIGNPDLARLLAEPSWERLYYQHLNDLLGRAYTTAYLGPWCEQLATLLPAQDFVSNCAFVDTRAAWVAAGSSDAVATRFPTVAFAVTTPDATVATAEVTLEGVGWVDVRTLEADGVALPVTWTDRTTWGAPVTLAEGDNTLVLVARDLHGAEVGRDTVTLRYTSE